MSWFARSIVNTIHGGGGGGDDSASGSGGGDMEFDRDAGEGEAQHPDTSNRGVKEDLSELKKTLTRQFWGVANFLAPQPDSSSPVSSSAAADPPPAGESPRMAGIRSDLAEIGGRVRSGISLLSNNLPVSEISKITSNFLSFGMDDVREDDDEEEGDDGVGDGAIAIGVTEEVLAFARNISMHPETWLDFPLLADDDECDDFDISDAQQKHALAVESFAPRLAALRIELCPSHMSEGCFWKIYFVLLHPRLNKHDAELLSTPQIVEARAKLQRLQSRRKQEIESPEGVSHRKEVLSPVSFGEHVVSQYSVSSEAVATPRIPLVEESTTIPVTVSETEKHPVFTSELQIVDKSVIEESPSSQTKKEISDDSKVTIHKYDINEGDDDGDEWLEEEETGEASGSAVTHVGLGNEDVSFSDLEEDYDHIMPKAVKATVVLTDS